MTVEELINELKQYDPKLPILLSGYEGGVYEAHGECTRQVLVALDVNNEWFYGPHEIVQESDADLYPTHKRTKGVYIK